MTLQVIHSEGNDDLARVFVGRFPDGTQVEFVESVQPPLTRSEKWVLIISSLDGCPFSCAICDAGGNYRGPLSTEQILAQIETMVTRRYPDRKIPAKKLKIQFARVGDPALNPAVIQVLDKLQCKYGQAVFPSVSTIAPKGSEVFLEKLLEVKNKHYNGRFQLQFSLHTTDESRRPELVPGRTLSFAQMALAGRPFAQPGDRKVTLNFATPVGYPLDPAGLLATFDPDHFCVKLTPVNPTTKALQRKLTGIIDPHQPEANTAIVNRFVDAGYDTILSIGELDENRIGSNCGMYLRHNRGQNSIVGATC